MSRFGIYVHNDGRYNDIISRNKKIIHTSKSLRHNFGVTINDTIVKLDDKIVANSEIPVSLKEKDGDTYINEINLDNSIINVNDPNDYGSLRKGEVPCGYLRYNKENNYVLNPPAEKYVETECNYSELDCPMISIRWYNMRISPGQCLNFTYFVDTYYMDSINREIFDNTFRVIIQLDNELIVYDETVYPGEHSVSIGPFSDDNEFGVTNEFNDIGFRWLGIKAIDSRGCASPENFLDFLVKAHQEPNYLQVTPEQLLNDYNIVEGEDCDNYPIIHTHPGEEWKNKEYIWYLNKKGFTKLFQDAKNAGYNGVKLPANKTYTISLYRNIANENEPINLNFVRYFENKVENSKYTEVKEVYKWNDFWELVKTANYHYIRGKNKEIDDICPLPTSKFPVVGNTTTGLSNGTHFIAYKLKEDNGKDSREAYQDCILLPDEFTLDMNGCTFIGSCPDFSMHGSRTLKLYDNFDTHVKNGKFICVYKQLDIAVVGESVHDINWARGNAATTYNVPLESVANISINGGSYCSIEDCEISYGAGYELAIAEREPPKTGKYSHTYMSTTFKEYLNNGYIDSNGVKHEDQIFYNLPMVYCKNDIKVTTGTYDLLRLNPFRSISFTMHYKLGTSNLIFVYFYDSNNNHIKTIKSHKRYILKVPKNASYFRVAMFGDVDKNGDNLNSAWTNLSSLFTIYGNYLTVGCSIINCYSHDHRTGSIHINMSEGTLIKNNRYERVGSLGGRWAVTNHVADFEEGGQFINRVGIMDCTVSLYSSAGGSSLGARSIGCHSAKNLTFVRNSGFSWYLLTGTFESGLWEDNSNMLWSFSPSVGYRHPHCIFRNNDIQSYLSTSASGYPYLSLSYLETINKQLDENYTSKCEDRIEYTITHLDTVFHKANIYNNYNFRRSENGLSITN